MSSRGDRLRRAAIWTGAGGAFLLAIALGWFLHGWLEEEELVVSVDRPVQVFAPETVVEGRLPNVIGLSEEDARRALSDAGVVLSAVSVKALPYVGPADLVVRQDPPSGSPVGNKPVLLEVSTPPEMPDLAGLGETEARATLTALGARIAVVDQYQPGAAEGTVLSTEPSAGAELTDRATLHVAEPLSSVFLTQLNPAASSCRSGEGAIVGGESAEEAIVCQPVPGANPRSATYALGGQIESFRATLGFDDEGDAETPVEFCVFADGRPVLVRTLEFGDVLPVHVPLLGRLQLRLEAVALGSAPSAAGLPIRAAFAEPQLVGSRSAIDRISEGLGE